MLDSKNKLGDLKVLFLYVLLSYPLFYFAYKFGTPAFGGEDFFSYYHLYKDWNFEKVDTPFNMRILSCFLVFLFNKAGFHYTTETVFAKFHPELDLQVYFNSVFVNYICIVLTCFVIYKLIRRVDGNEVFRFMAGLLYLLAFGTLFFSLKPLTEAPGVLLFAVIYYSYVEKSKWYFFFLLLALFQREYIFIVFGMITLLDLFKTKEKFYLAGLIGCIGMFGIYLLLRNTVFHTPRYDYQLSFDTYLNSFFDTGLSFWSFFRQSILSLNLVLLYLAILAYKRLKGLELNKYHLLMVLVLLAQVIVMSIMTHFGNNAGRYYFYITPLIILFIALEAKPLLEQKLRFGKQ